ncbi:8467_t:CDS:1 [Ambispora leptoticha]|uniref:8467_t:CDS:1 n=1 Tax=Ambispora leptoticha TaxID=144679 RepID=A0A9N9GCN0_9GLOM|nr:8467_t:CDS:1 [Ambispora leptoticha]
MSSTPNTQTSQTPPSSSPHNNKQLTPHHCSLEISIAANNNIKETLPLPQSSSNINHDQTTTPLLTSIPSTKTTLNQQLVHLFRLTTLRSCRKLKRILSLMILFSILAFALFLLTWPILHPRVTLFTFKFRNYLHNEGYLGCSLRKQPILFMVDTDRLLAVWESNCILNNVKLRWYLSSNDNSKKNIKDTEENNDNKSERNLYGGGISETILDSTHNVYKTTIGPVPASGTYTYEITYSPIDDGNEILLARYSFSFFLPSTHLSLQFPGNQTDIHSNKPATDTLSQSINYPIRILAISDNQFGLSIFNHLLDGVVKRHPPPNFIIHAGDAVQDYDRLQQWQTDFYDPLTHYHLAQNAPLIYAHGNHDFDPSLEYPYTSSQLWHAFTIANTRWIVLDSNMDDVLQDKWLLSELQSRESREAMFRVVVVHIPPFIEFWDPDTWHNKGEKHWGEFVRLRFVPLFQEFGVDLVISGHQHNYQRGNLNGITYTIIGGAGGELDYQRVEDWHIYDTVQKTYHYVTIEIWDRMLKWVAYNIDGLVIDKFDLQK